MKITDLKTYVVHCYRTNWVFVKVETDEGISGIGEATLEMKEKTVEAAVLELKDYLLGKDPREIERHFHVMYRDSYWRTGPVLMSALSGVEMALWDISAKELGVPVYRLLGGKCNDRVKAYANAWFAGAKTPEAFAEKAKIAVAQRGFRALKWDPFGSAYQNMSTKELDDALAVVGAVRDAVGNAVDLLIEGHGRFNVPTACAIARELEPFRPLFFEEPVQPDNMDAPCRRACQIADQHRRRANASIIEISSVSCLKNVPLTSFNPTSHTQAGWVSARRSPRWPRRTKCPSRHTIPAGRSPMRRPYSWLPARPISTYWKPWPRTFPGGRT